MADVSKKLKIICLTGGPGGGKTAVADVLKREFQHRVFVLPETASLLYNGGFPRADGRSQMQQVQLAIYHVQKHAEALAQTKTSKAKILLCDRGTLDCAAYFPGGLSSFLKAIDSSERKECRRYKKVIHLETPGASRGYDFSNPVRTESPDEALKLDRKIQKVWSGHPDRILIQSRDSFLQKVSEVVDIVRAELS